MFTFQELLLAAGIGIGFFSFFHPCLSWLRPLSLALCILAPLSWPLCMLKTGLVIAIFYLSRSLSYREESPFWMQLAAVSLPFPAFLLWVLFFAQFREPVVLLAIFYCTILLWY